jgi:hypothetical protein
MDDAARSWREARTTYEELAGEGDESAVFLRDVVRRLSGTPAESRCVAMAWEECLGIAHPDEAVGRPSLAVVSDAVPNDWPRCEVEVRDIVDGVFAVLERHPCVGPEQAAASVLRLLPKVLGEDS